MKYSSGPTDWQSAEEHLPVIGTASPDLAVAQTCQEGNYLDGLAQSHLVSQNSSCLLAVQFPQPPNTCLLVPTTTNIHKKREHGKWWMVQTVTQSAHELVMRLVLVPVREHAGCVFYMRSVFIRSCIFDHLGIKSQKFFFLYRMLTHF